MERCEGVSFPFCRESEAAPAELNKDAEVGRSRKTNFSVQTRVDLGWLHAIFPIYDLVEFMYR